MVRNQKIIFLKQRPDGCDELGQERKKWLPEGKPALAKVSSVTGKLYYEAARANEENTLLFKVRYSFLPKDFNKIDYRLLYNGTQYKIKQFADVDQRHSEVQIRGVSV